MTEINGTEQQVREMIGIMQGSLIHERKKLFMMLDPLQDALKRLRFIEDAILSEMEKDRKRQEKRSQ